MEVGTFDELEEEPKPRKLRRSRSGRGGPSGGNNEDGDDGNRGNNVPKGDGMEETNYPSNKFRIGMWFLLLVVMMTFGGLIAAYVVISTNDVLEWNPFQFPKQIWLSTALLFLSSLTYVIAKNALDSDKQERAKTWFVAATILGGVFISSQIFLWLSLYRQGVYMASNPYAGFFYILTAVHAVHVIGGIVALGYIVLTTCTSDFKQGRTPEPTRSMQMRSVGIGILWEDFGLCSSVCLVFGNNLWKS